MAQAKGGLGMEQPGRFPRLNILGINIDSLTIEQATSYLVAQASQPSSAPIYVVKPYVEFMTRAAHDKHVRDLLNDADLSVPDGVSLNWAAYYLYGGKHNLLRWFLTLTQIITRPKAVRSRLPESFAGTNFTLHLLRAAAQANVKVFLVGSPKQNSIESTAIFIRKTIPGISIVGSHSGRMRGMSFGQINKAWQDSVAIDINKTKPDLILVGMGFPLQEQVIARLVNLVDHGVFVGEGGTFDYQELGGKRKKAPTFMQKIGLEWLWRLILEPKRIKRQLAIPSFMWHVYLRGRH
jgi:N-acetylglucosaminyldiphosphoundecaprenol N-acetyl-beta-D-mannosaminyltransferase